MTVVSTYNSSNFKLFLRTLTIIFAGLFASIGYFYPPQDVYLSLDAMLSSNFLLRDNRLVLISLNNNRMPFSIKSVKFLICFFMVSNERFVYAFFAVKRI